MASESAEISAPMDAFTERVAREHLRLVQNQVGRIPLAYALNDLFLCWLLSRIGLLWAGILWLLVQLVVQTWRFQYVRRLQAQAPADPHAALNRLSMMLVVMGLLRGALVLVMFSRPLQTEHYMFTMTYLGTIAGTVASVAGQVRPFLLWAVFVAGSLAFAWIMQGDLTGLWLGLLVISLVALLAGHVSDEGQGLQQLVKLACDNEALAESLRSARDQSEAASSSKTRFFAAASHDLRQPLHALSINATTLELLAQRQGDPLIKDLSHSINRALSQSNGLLDSLLDISNLDANAVKPQMRTILVGTLLVSVLEEFTSLAAQKGLALCLNLPDRSLVVRTDPDLLRRILNNLVGNALKFTNAGSVTLSALNMPLVEGIRRVRLVVSDSGPGIAPEEQQRVFEEFYQIGNTSRDRSKGLGLGLSIVKRTAALLGADLRLISAPGQGTSVELWLDQAQVMDGPPSHSEQEVRSEIEIGVLCGLKVLVVDDEAEILSSVEGLLTQLGCAVRCASDGVQALTALDDKFLPQVLLVDHRLRNESGTDVIARLRAVLGPVPAVLITGDTEPAIIRSALASGYQVMHKPVHGPLLARALRKATATRMTEVS